MMWKKALVFISCIFVIIVFVAIISNVLFISEKTVSVKKQPLSPSEIVAEIERSFIAYHWREITFEEFKSKMDAYIHPYYKETYFETIKRSFDSGYTALNVKSPENIKISKPYFNAKEDRLIVYQIIPVDNAKGDECRIYTFSKDGDVWKISGVSNYYLIQGREGDDQIRERFLKHNGESIEYNYFSL